MTKLTDDISMKYKVYLCKFKYLKFYIFTKMFCYDEYN